MSLANQSTDLANGQRMRLLFLGLHLAFRFENPRLLGGSRGGCLLFLLAQSLGLGCRVGGRLLARHLSRDLAEMPCDNVARAADRILYPPRHIRLGPRGNGIPADLEPLESRREQGIVRSSAVALDGRRDRADLGPELLELTLMCELSIAL